MSELNQEQLDKFHSILRRYGLEPSDALEKIDTGESNGPTVLSTNPEESHYPPAGWISCNNIQELKEKVGVRDEDIDNGVLSDEHINYPPEPSETLINLVASAPTGCDLEAELAKLPTDKDCVGKARLAYVYGHSGKVKDYEEAINRISFPQTMEIPVYAAQDIVVTPDNPLRLTGSGGNPIIVNYGTVTVRPGGYIEVNNAPINWTSQQFISESSANENTMRYGAASGPKGQNGGKGNTGGSGANGKPAETYSDKNGTHCKTPPTDGANGGDGGTGGVGQPGQNGLDYGGGSQELGALTGPVTISYGAGNGGNGGNGGQGGDGGPGGKAGTNYSPCTAARDGARGKGGKGGNGGPGGNGGTSQDLYLTYRKQDPAALVKVDYTTGLGGNGGAAGAPGSGNGNLGSGEVGANGNNGQVGKVYVQIITD